MNPDKNLHVGLLFSLFLIFIWSGIGCHDVFTWLLEVSPVIVGTVVLLASYSRFRFTRLVCWLLWVHATVLMVGGHYTYAQVPFFNWVRDHFHLARNHYDRVGHFAQGFVPAMVAREILIRNKAVASRGWLLFIVTCICLAISALYELFEWGVAVATGMAADAFLGTQGDVWDTQSDMGMALVGALLAQMLLNSWHDKAIEGMKIDE